MRHLYHEPAAPLSLLGEILELSSPLHEVDELQPLIDRIKQAKIVLIGEATHGTSEYYRWRSAITQKLIQDHHFDFVAVEGDWPECFHINDFVKSDPASSPSADETLKQFRRWPTWMWANQEVEEFIVWQQQYNATHTDHTAGFYGLDVYSLWESLAAIMRVLKEKDHEAYIQAKKLLNCFQFLGENAEDYTRSLRLLPDSCEQEALDLLTALRQAHLETPVGDREQEFFLQQDAYVVKNAESYYRTLARTGAESWNVRDHHMMDTLSRLLTYHGPQAKGIVWAHNTHIGDARYTDMHEAGLVNLGQLAREAYGEEKVALIGFSSYEGEVMAGRRWEAPAEVMTIPQARQNSWEHLFHQALMDNAIFFPEIDQHQEAFFQPRGHRAIGVVYHPEAESFGNYVPTILPKRYDALIYFDQTKAVSPLPTDQFRDEEFPDTFPSAL
jgi:erythromycin esterase-like protein